MDAYQEIICRNAVWLRGIVYSKETIDSMREYVRDQKRLHRPAREEEINKEAEAFRKATDLSHILNRPNKGQADKKAE